MTQSGKTVSISSDLKMLMPPSSYWPASANVYIFEDNGGISLFDVGCGNPASIERIFAAIESLGWGSRPVRKIILSHAHPDHSGAMGLLSSRIKAEEIILHHEDLPYALNPERLMSAFDIPLCRRLSARTGETDLRTGKGPHFQLLEFFEAAGCPMSGFEPTITVTEDDTISVGNYSLRVIHTPGHAPGHMSLYDAGKRILLAGDIIGEMLAWYSPSSGGVKGYLESLEKVEPLDVKLALPSHGGVIENLKRAVVETRQKLLDKDSAIESALRDGARYFEQLLGMFFDSPSRRFFPGIPILESHLQRLEEENRIVSRDGSYFLTS